MDQALGPQRLPAMERIAPWLLGAILILGFIVRSLGPLSEPALGQTDAYAHLQFLNDILASGRLRHPFYPPGYYWLLAIPARVFGIDAYGIVRYAGAFFGCGLIATLYLAARQAFGRHAALWTAFLAAACPLFHWLQKTGVGAFPSQWGLALTPWILWSWDALLRGQRRQGAGFIVGIALLAISTPMILIDLLPLLALDFGVRWRYREIVGLRTVVILCAAAIATGTAIVTAGYSPILADIASAVSGVPREADTAWRALIRIAITYIAPERWGPQGGMVRLAAIAVGGFLVIGLQALRQTTTLARTIALWTLLSWAQSVFGVFQFSRYMRAGWMLLAGLTLLGGWFLVYIAPRVPVRSRRVLLSVILASGLISLVYPPHPQPHLSPAESDLVRIARDLSAWSTGQAPPPDGSLKPLTAAGTLTVWSRAFNAYPGHQGDPLHAFIENRDRITLHSVEGPVAAAVVFDPGTLHLIILDDQAGHPPIAPLMRIVNPALSADFEQTRAHLMSAATALRGRVDSAEAQGWNSRRHRMDSGLELIWLFGTDAD